MKGNYKFLYTSEKPLQMKLAGGFCLFFGFVATMEMALVGLGLILLGLLLLLNFSGIELDFENKKYREINSFGIVDFGGWKSMPDLKYISVFKAKMVSTVTSNAGQTVSPSHEVIQVNLITQQNRRIKIYEGRDPEEAFKLAKEIAPILGQDIWDAASTKEGAWL